MKLSDKILFGVIVFLVVGIAVGTVFGITHKKINSDEVTKAIENGSIETNESTESPEEETLPKTAVNINKKISDKTATFTGIGTIRATTKPYSKTEYIEEDSETKTKVMEIPGTTIVITPFLSYPEEDTAFFEELARKRVIIKGVIANYFLDYTQNELLAKGEETVKRELVDLINEKLILGKISEVYFSDYMYLQ